MTWSSNQTNCFHYFRSWGLKTLASITPYLTPPGFFVRNNKRKISLRCLHGSRESKKGKKGTILLPLRQIHCRAESLKESAVIKEHFKPAASNKMKFSLLLVRCLAVVFWCPCSQFSAGCSVSKCSQDSREITSVFSSVAHLTKMSSDANGNKIGVQLGMVEKIRKIKSLVDYLTRQKSSWILDQSTLFCRQLYFVVRPSQDWVLSPDGNRAKLLCWQVSGLSAYQGTSAMLVRMFPRLAKAT